MIVFRSSYIGCVKIIELFRSGFKTVERSGGKESRWIWRWMPIVFTLCPHWVYFHGTWCTQHLSRVCSVWAIWYISSGTVSSTTFRASSTLPLRSPRRTASSWMVSPRSMMRMRPGRISPVQRPTVSVRDGCWLETPCRAHGCPSPTAILLVSPIHRLWAMSECHTCSTWLHHVASVTRVTRVSGHPSPAAASWLVSPILAVPECYTCYTCVTQCYTVLRLLHPLYVFRAFHALHVFPVILHPQQRVDSCRWSGCWSVSASAGFYVSTCVVSRQHTEA